MLEPIHPFPVIFAAVTVGVNPFSMLFVEAIKAFIATAVLPSVNSVAVHDSRLKFALKVTTISPLENSFARHLIRNPLPRVSRAISPEVHAITLLYTITKAAKIVAAI